MMKSDRARQFLPFAALKGYEDMLRKMEREIEPRKELTEEDARRLNEEIRAIQKGMRVHILHYNNGVYTVTEGKVSYLDIVLRKIFIEENVITFDDIWEIVILDSEKSYKEKGDC